MPHLFRHEQHPPCDERDPIVALLLQLHRKVDWIMATVQDVAAAMANEDTKIDALVQAYKDLVAQVAANANDPAALQALVDDANAKAAAIDAALNPPATGGTGATGTDGSTGATATA